MLMLVVMAVRVLMPIVVLVRPGVWVGVTQLAVTVQIPVDQFIGGRSQGHLSVARARIVGVER
ncbi:MAG TPA: hypothetical protein VG147_13540 [Solirubrobacteraceae bacterium]|nr:hypothetical protein [Solirubrobacteraceae bacterium]